MRNTLHQLSSPFIDHKLVLRFGNRDHGTPNLGVIAASPALSLPKAEKHALTSLRGASAGTRLARHPPGRPHEAVDGAGHQRAAPRAAAPAAQVHGEHLGGKGGRGCERANHLLGEFLPHVTSRALITAGVRLMRRS